MPNTLKELALRTSAAGWSSWSLANVGLAVLLFGMAGCQTQPPPRLTPQLRKTTVHPHPLPASLSASGEPEFVWWPTGSSGIQIGLGLFSPGMLGVKIRGNVSDDSNFHENEKRPYPTLKLLVRKADQPWMPLKLRNPPTKPSKPNTNAIATLDYDGALMLNLPRLGNSILPIRLQEYEWPTFPNGDFEIQVELDFDSSEQPNGSRNTLKSGILVVPATALLVPRPSASSAVVGPVSAKILDFGTYWPKGVGRRVLDPEIANHSLLQHEHIVFEQQTNDIPKVLNTRFGYRFEIGGLRPTSRVKLTYVTTHPPIHAADGRVVTQFQTHLQRTVGLDGMLRGFTGYMFEENYELVTGEWMMEVFLDDERVLQKTFNIFDPLPVNPKNLDYE